MEQPKQTGLSSIASTLNLGSEGDQVKALQQYLVGLGYTGVKPDGVFGPITEAAVKQFQLDNNLPSDGHFGPQTLAKARTIGSTGTAAGSPGTGKTPDDASYMFRSDNGQLNDKFVPKTQEDLDKFYNLNVASHPVFSGNSPEALANATATGDFSGLMNQDGKPFTQEDQDAALKEANSALSPGFEAGKQKDTADTQASLESKVRDYGDFLNTEKTNFETDKNTLDKNAADNGVLFSGGRIQKQNALLKSYNDADAAKLASTGADIGSTARGYQYSYGNDAAKAPSLSQYYQLGGNSYNPNVARNGVTSNPLSTIYNTGNYNFQGTTVNANKANALTRAAGLLANKGNKLVATGYQNHF